MIRIVAFNIYAGGILSANLFAFYSDEIIKTTHSTPAGCRLGLNIVNIMAYADDVVLFPILAPGACINSFIK